jgi:hypothetical protein
VVIPYRVAEAVAAAVDEEGMAVEFLPEQDASADLKPSWKSRNCRFIRLETNSPWFLL